MNKDVVEFLSPTDLLEILKDFDKVTSTLEADGKTVKITKKDRKSAFPDEGVYVRMIFDDNFQDLKLQEGQFNVLEIYYHIPLKRVRRKEEVAMANQDWLNSNTDDLTSVLLPGPTEDTVKLKYTFSLIGGVTKDYIKNVIHVIIIHEMGLGKFLPLAKT